MNIFNLPTNIGVQVSNQARTDIESAFNALRPAINTTGNTVTIDYRGNQYNVPLSIQAGNKQGFTR